MESLQKTVRCKYFSTTIHNLITLIFYFITLEVLLLNIIKELIIYDKNTKNIFEQGCPCVYAWVRTRVRTDVYA